MRADPTRPGLKDDDGDVIKTSLRPSSRERTRKGNFNPAKCAEEGVSGNSESINVRKGNKVVGDWPIKDVGRGHYLG